MFTFKYRKTAQAVAHLLRCEPSRQMNYMRLVKLLYIADRESLRETGRSITGDRVVAMKQGPVLSHLLDLIRGLGPEFTDWSRFFQREGYQLRLVGEPGNGQLCRYDVEKLAEVSDRYSSYGEWDMVDLTHGFEEWKKNDPGDSSKPIPLKDILNAVGRSEDIDAIENDARTDALFERTFGD